jgi:hypothetical protein
MSGKKQKLSRSKKAAAQRTPQKNTAAQGVQGQPGYRTRGNRSGYDPLDTEAESGHMIGVFVRHLFTGRLRTKSAVYLALMAVVSILGMAPMLLTIWQAFQGNIMPSGAWVLIAIAFLIGLAMLVNLVKNLLHLNEK